MKKLIYLVAMLFCVHTLHAQFQHSYGTSEFEKGSSVRKTLYDKGYVIGGEMFSGPMGNRDAVLIKTDYDGKLLWQKQYGWKADEIFESVRISDSDPKLGYFCLGTTNSVGAGEGDVLFVRTDLNGNPLYVKTYGGQLADLGHCIQIIKEKEADEYRLIMVGTSSSFTSDPKMYIVKTDLKGNTIKSVIVGYKGFQQGYWIEQTSDGGFIAVGSSTCACGIGATKDNEDIYIVKLNSNLDVEWARTIGSGKNVIFDDIAYSVKETKEGFVVTGRTESFGVNNSNDAFLLKLDLKGNFQWLRNYGLDEKEIGFDLLSIENSFTNYSYVITGSASVDYVSYAMLMGLNYYGDIVWSRGYGMKREEIALELDHSLENGYVFTGIVSSFGAGSYDAYHVVTDNAGNSYCPFCEVKLELKSDKHETCISDEFFYEQVKGEIEHEIRVEKKEFEQSQCPYLKESIADIKENAIEKQIDVYPNPAINQITITYSIDFVNGDLRIFNSVGQLVYDKIIDSGMEITIPLNDFENGIYMVRLTNKEGAIQTSKFLKSER